jgi:hypothetical protein
MLTFRRRPLTAVVVDRSLSSRAVSFHTLGRISVAVVEAEAGSDVAMVEAASVRCSDYLVGDCRNCTDLVAAVGFPYQRNS